MRKKLLYPLKYNGTIEFAYGNTEVVEDNWTNFKFIFYFYSSIIKYKVTISSYIFLYLLLFEILVELKIVLQSVSARMRLYICQNSYLDLRRTPCIARNN